MLSVEYKSYDSSATQFTQHTKTAGHCVRPMSVIYYTEFNLFAGRSGSAIGLRQCRVGFEADAS